MNVLVPGIALINAEEVAADLLVIVEGHDLGRDHLLLPKGEVVHQDPDHPDVIDEVVQEKRNPTQQH